MNKWEKLRFSSRLLFQNDKLGGFAKSVIGNKYGSINMAGISQLL